MECIRKHKDGETTNVKCPNCKGNHPAWNRRCKTRLDRIQAALPQEHRRPVTENRAPVNRQPQGPHGRPQAPTMRRRLDWPQPHEGQRRRTQPQQQQRREEREPAPKPQRPPRNRCHIMPPKKGLPAISLDHCAMKAVASNFTYEVLLSSGFKIEEEELKSVTDNFISALLKAADLSLTFPPPASAQPLPSHSTTNNPPPPTNPQSSSSTSPPSSSSPSSPPTSSVPPQKIPTPPSTLPQPGFPPLNPPSASSPHPIAAARGDSPPPSPPPSPKPLKRSAFRRIMAGILGH